MQFRAEFFPKPSEVKIHHGQKILLIGSCFTAEIGNKLAANKFSVLQNPHGIVFNPVSISRALKDYVTEKKYVAEDLFYHHELYGSWQHHTRFSNPDATETLNAINGEIQEASAFLKQADWVIVTLGSAFVYELTDENGTVQQVVANCHKVPADQFRKRLLSTSEAEMELQQMVDTVRHIRKETRVIFTVSPVRHLRDGFVENNRSKAVLIQAVHAVTDNDMVQYFPSYELVMDDLRDYRFYAEDLAHPNYFATQYVWEKFISVYMDVHTVTLMKSIHTIRLAVQHKPFNPTAQAHKQFLLQHLDKSIHLQESHTGISFQEEIDFFRNQLEKYHSG